MTQHKCQDAFTKFTELAFSVLNKDEKDRRSNLPRVIITKEDLRQKITKIEQHEAFYELVAETRTANGWGYHEYGEEKSRIHQRIWAGAVENFFRRSGFYLNCFDGIPYDPNEIFNFYHQSFSRKEMQITYMAPIASVELDFTEEVLQFDDFSIRHFSEEDKERWGAKNRVNEVFYPRAAIDLEDALDKRRIADYSFLERVAAYPIPRLVKDNNFFPWSEMEQHRVVFSNYPEIEDALKRMVLFDWESQFFDSGIGFDVPVLFKFDDNLLGRPSFVPDLSVLTTEPDVRTHPHTGEEIERSIVPFLFHHTPQETQEMKLFLESIGRSLASLKRKGPGWEFIEVALGFLLKAFFSRGVEQLLWHIIVIESLLGDNVVGLTKKLGERLSGIWGECSIGTCFEKLYDYRCDLVHGNKEVLNNKIQEDQLKEARVLARGTLCWFINCLAHLLDSNKSPRRSKVLKVIDGDASDSENLQNVAACLPADFPGVRKWLCLQKDHVGRL